MLNLYNCDRQDFKRFPFTKTPTGGYKAYATVGIANLLLPYFLPNGQQFYQYIDEENLFNSDSIDSLKGLPITLGHPWSNTFTLNRSNALIGSTLQEYFRDGNSLVIATTIQDQRGIDLIEFIRDSKDGFVELSPAYYLIDRQWNPEKEAFLQVGRTYDHLAMLQIGDGRAGQEQILHVDSKLFFFQDMPHNLCYVRDSLDNGHTFTRIAEVSSITTDIDSSEYDTVTTTVQEYRITMTTTTIKLNNQEITLPAYELDGKVCIAVEDLNPALNMEHPEIKSLKTQLAVLKGENEGLKLTSDSRQKEIENQIGERIRESTILWNQVKPIFQQDNKDFEPDYSLTATEIKELYIRTYLPSITLDGFTELEKQFFIDGVWSTINLDQKNQKTNEKVQSQLNSLITDSKNRPPDNKGKIKTATTNLHSRMMSNAPSNN